MNSKRCQSLVLIRIQECAALYKTLACWLTYTLLALERERSRQRKREVRQRERRASLIAPASG